MAVVEVHPEPIDGPWIEGFALDRHVISSRPIGYVGEHMQFETTRSTLGELVYQLKYRNGPLTDIVETAVAFVTERWNGVIDCVVPPPPSLHRTKQPAVLTASGVCGNSGGAVPRGGDGQGVGDVADEERRVARTRPAPLYGHPGGYRCGPGSAGLLIDDLWETGSTLRRVAEVLGQMGATEVRALAMTRTK
jgi:predicted amidophosphoribosyltransferase